MKVNLIRWNVPGAKYCVHQNGMTAVVSETDSVYIYKGGNDKPLQIIVFNPKTGWAGSVRGESARQSSLRELSEDGEAKQVYEQGLRLLEAAHYTPAPSEEEKILGWMKSLMKRPLVDREKIKDGHHLIVSIEKIRVDESGKPVMPKSLRCSMLGDYMSTDGSFNFIFQVKNDPDLRNGIWIEEKDDRNTSVHSISGGITWHYIAIYSKIAQLTREEAKWLGTLLPPFPAQRFLNFHQEMIEADKTENKERAILRAVSRTAGNPGPGTVAL